MILALTPAHAFQLIGSPQLVREDKVVPKAFPDCPNSLYQPEYDWLFQYERQIAAFLEKWLRPYRYELIGEKGILCEALSNAFYHGHHKDPCKAIYVRILLGEKGLLVEIKDSGAGFNVQKVYDSYQNKKRYFSSAGNGIHRMAQSKHFGIFYAAGGTTFYMLYLFKSDLTHLTERVESIDRK